MVAGGYLFLTSIRVYHFFSLGYTLHSFGPVRLTTGMTLIPLCLGIVMIFYNARNWLGWLLFLLGAHLQPLLAVFGLTLAALAWQSLRHPLAMARVWTAAVHSGGAHPARVARRLAHLAQAALVAPQ